MTSNSLLNAAERRSEQLWLLAFFLLMLLASALYVIQASEEVPLLTLFLPVNRVLGSHLTSAALLAMILLVCTYLQEQTVKLRKASRQAWSELQLSNSTLQRMALQIACWTELSHALITNSDLDQLMDLIAHTALEVMEADTVSLMLLEPEQEELQIVAGRGLSPEVVRKTRVAMGSGIAGYVAQRGEPVLLRSSSPDPRLMHLLKREHEIGSAVSVPLMLRERPVGALNVNRKPGREEFTEQDVRALSVFASQAASAIEKAQLYRRGQEELERSQEMLTRLEQAQAQLIHSEKMASLGLLAGGVAHEINNPLTVIRGRSELLLASTPADAPIRKSLELVLTESDRIAKIVRGLLDFSREHGSREMTLVNLNHVVEQTLELTSHIMKAENVEIATELNPELPTVLANAGRLEQVFMNVAVNALQAMPQGGKLHVRTWSEVKRVHVSFADTGCGIPEDVIPRIFEPFFTTKAEGEGTGLGLAVSHGIMKAHGGQINIHSVVGEGTVVTIDLPAAREE